MACRMEGNANVTLGERGVVTLSGIFCLGPLVPGRFMKGV